MDKKQYIFKNGGFPPIKYCPELNIDKSNNVKFTKERFFSNTPRQNINIRQLLTESTNKKPIIVPDEPNDIIEVTNTL